LAPITLVVYLRITLLYRLLRRAPDDLLVVVFASKADPKSWFSTVIGNLDTLAQHPLLHELRGIGQTGWIQLLRHGSPLVKKSIYKALKSDMFNHRDAFVKISPTLTAQGEEQSCTMCEYVCPTVQGMNWHLFRDHGLRLPLRKRIHASFCCACLQDFFTRERVVVHVTRSKRCRSFYETYMPDLPHEVLCRLEQEALECTIELAKRGHRRMFTNGVTPLRLYGPLPPQSNMLGISHENLLSTGKQGCVSNLRPPAVENPEVPAPHPTVERPWLFAS